MREIRILFILILTGFFTYEFWPQFNPAPLEQIDYAKIQEIDNTIRKLEFDKVAVMNDGGDELARIMVTRKGINPDEILLRRKPQE